MEQILEYGSVILKEKPSTKTMEFSNSQISQPIVIAEKTFSKLLKALDDITLPAQEMAQTCLDLAEGLAQGQSREAGLKDEIFWTTTLDTYSRSNQVRLEGAVYKNKVYIFLKRFYFDRECALWKPSKGCVGLSLKEDFPLIRQLIQSTMMPVDSKNPVTLL